MSISLVLFAVGALLAILAYFIPGRRILCGAVLLIAIAGIVSQTGITS